MMLVLVSQLWHEHMGAVFMSGRKSFFQALWPLVSTDVEDEAPMGGIES